MIRPAVMASDVDRAIAKVEDAYSQCASPKGAGAFASSHEAVGVIAEEFYELVDAVRSHTTSTTREYGIASARVDHEIIDLAVACVHALASRPYMD